MIRTVVRAIALALLGVGVFAPALVASTGSVEPAYEETVIRDYVADFTVGDNGDLRVTEKLTVNFPFYGKHGIFRFWDLADPNDSHARRIPRDFSVTRDGTAEPYAWTSEKAGRYRVAKIGSADTILDPGDHVYVLSYAIRGVLTPRKGQVPTQFYWNLVPGGWQQQIDHATLTVHLPEPALDVQCAVGAGASGGCRARGEGSKDLTVEVANLAKLTPVTVRAGQDLPTPPAGDSVPWPVRFDSVFGQSSVRAMIYAALALLAGLVGWVLSRGTREPTPPYPLQYAPPEGIGPAQAQYLFRERLGRETFVASLMEAAEKGAVELGRGPAGSWTISDKQGPEGWRTVDPVTQSVAGLLSGPRASFLADRSSVSAGKVLQREIGQLSTNTKAWARSAGHMAAAGLGSLGGLMVLGAAALTVWLLFSPPFGVRMLAFVPGLFAIGAIELLAIGSSTKRTASGRELWSRIGGFHRVLSTPSSVERFGFSGRKELYTAYLPWAVAFGCADAWAAKYRTEVGEEPPVPAYFGGYGYGGYGGSPAQAMINDFSSTLDSAISSYEATQRSSSSGGGGGGGFSGGGGGGGGGGGSW